MRFGKLAGGIGILALAFTAVSRLSALNTAEYIVPVGWEEGKRKVLAISPYGKAKEKLVNPADLLADPRVRTPSELQKSLEEKGQNLQDLHAKLFNGVGLDYVEIEKTGGNPFLCGMFVVDPDGDTNGSSYQECDEGYRSYKALKAQEGAAHLSTLLATGPRR